VTLHRYPRSVLSQPANFGVILIGGVCQEDADRHASGYGFIDKEEYSLILRGARESVQDCDTAARIRPSDRR
jgi:hypothetical protein